jgi:hypothetical protein
MQRLKMLKNKNLFEFEFSLHITETIKIEIFSISFSFTLMIAIIFIFLKKSKEIADVSRNHIHLAESDFEHEFCSRHEDLGSRIAGSLFHDIYVE